MAKIFSTEDGNLSSNTRVVKTRDYSDIDLSLDARTSTDGDVFKKTDAASVKQAIKNLLLTNRFEKPYRPNYGANLSGLLFELMSEDVGEQISDNIKRAIETYEPRAKIIGLKVTATPDYNSVSVTIEFRVINTGVVDTLRISLNPTSTPTIPVLPLAVTPVVEYDNIIKSEADNELATYLGDLIQRDFVQFPANALLTDPNQDVIQSLFNGFFEGVLVADSAELEGILTVPNEDQIFLQNGADFLSLQ